jgi:hypothetical protein
LSRSECDRRQPIPADEENGWFMLHILYFVHDLADPAVRRRVLMLQAGGARVTLAGFRRDDNALADIHGITPIELGRTRDAQFTQRAAAVALSMLRLHSILKRVEKPDVILARNLEMLAVANRARTLFGERTPIAYECLDIHRMLLRNDVIGRAMRDAERRFGGGAALLLTSSPAFVEHYFRSRSGLDLPAVLLENKVLTLQNGADAAAPSHRLPDAGKPWTIGWFGALRCSRSLDLLAAFSRQMEGRFEIVLRGRPARTELRDFDAFVKAEPFVHFHGAYRSPEDLAEIYGETHFSWAIDFFEEGLNSSWLLPNRLYEGCLYGTIPIAMADTETGRFLASRKIGLTLDRADAADLAASLGDMDEERYLAAFRTLAAQDRRQWLTDEADCRSLVQRLASLTHAGQPTVGIQALSQLQENRGGLQ